MSRIENMRTRGKRNSDMKKATDKKQDKADGKGAEPKISEMRGVVTFDTNEIILLVRAGVEEVAAEFAKLKKLKTWVKDFCGKEVTVKSPCYLVYRLEGHTWTIVEPYQSGNEYPEQADAKALSKALKTTAIFYGNSDTGGATAYDLFDRGKRLEHFESTDEGLEFESSVRDVLAPEDGPEIYPFVDAFIRQQDAFVFAWAAHAGAHFRKPGDKVKLSFSGDFGEVIVERLDFVSA
jgi:hypothetical protein